MMKTTYSTQKKHGLSGKAWPKQLITPCLFLLLITTAQATIWRVNNKSGISADFTSLDSAQAAASAGDTLYIEGAVNGYGNFTLTKPLTLIGSGYFLAQNQPDTTRAGLLNAKINNLYLNAGAEGTVVMGLEIVGSSSSGVVSISVDSVKILRNKIQRVAIGSNRKNILITQNYIVSNSGYAALSIGGSCQDIFVLNNIMSSSNLNWTCIGMSTNAENIVIQNNILYGRNTVYNAAVSYNILRGGSFSGDALNYPNYTSNNMSDEADFGTNLGNLANVDMTTVFTQSSQSPDKYYELKEDSPARDIGGVDMGPFGGANPYRLSGIVALPSIFEVQVTGNPASRLDVTFKAKANN